MKAGKNGNIFVVSCYLLITVVAFAGTFFCESDTSDEKRLPTDFPSIGQVDFKDTCRQMESYFNDHFGFRTQFLRSFKFLRNRVFKLNSQISVITGEDGWFFLRKCVDEYTGKKSRINDAQCKQVAGLISETAEKLAKDGIAFYFVVVPDKDVVYSEKLPDWAEKSPKPTTKEKIFSLLADDQNVKIIDLKEPMLQARQNRAEHLFYKVDTHWNAIGAYEGYKSIVGMLNEDGLGLKSDLDCSYRELTIDTGDLSSLVGEFKLREDVKFELQIKDRIEEQIIKMDPEHPRPQIIKTDNPDANAKLFMIRDSFTTEMIPLFAQSFGNCCFYWSKNMDESLKLIKEESPDIVILESIERYLYQLYEENCSE